MKDNESKNLVFMGGSIDVKAQGQFVNEKNELVKYGPKVDLSTVVDRKGAVNPAIFLNMLDAVQKDPDIMKDLKELAAWKRN